MTTGTKRQLEVAKLFAQAISGDANAKHTLAEGISTSDIPVQLTPTLSAVALKSFNETPQIWKDFAAREVVSDFESSPFYSFVWGDQDIEKSTNGVEHIEGGLALIPEYGEYPVLRFTASDVSVVTRKNGVQIKYSWEALYKTRNFNMLRRTFEEFGRRAARTEDIEATRVLVTAAGVNSANFNGANQNLATANPPLSYESLQAAFEQIAGQTQVLGGGSGRITVPSQWVLVVPPALAVTADQILAITGQETSVVNGTETVVTTAGNAVKGRIAKVVVNNYLTQIDGSANADTTWFLLPAVGTMPNPAVVNVFLEGEEGPKVFVQKTTTGNPEDGAFIDDSYSTKTRHVVAGGFIDPAGTLVSNGSGS